jgi:hypothetical protein
MENVLKLNSNSTLTIEWLQPNSPYGMNTSLAIAINLNKKN